MSNRSQTQEWMSCCRICPRECGVNRLEGQKGRCGSDASVRLSRAALHQWEEPCISGTNGSGAVFFTGCSLGCDYCQNRAISGGQGGIPVGKERLGEIFLNLQGQGAHNINLVTGDHYIPQIAESILWAKNQGLKLPVVFNCSGYEKAETIRLLDGLVDVYLPDFKYADQELAALYSKAPDYPVLVKQALEEMVRQCPNPVFDEEGLMKKGVLVRHLLLPGHVKNSKEVIRYLLENYQNQIYISLMSQYTPMEQMRDDPLLSRRVTKREYERLVSYAIDLGLEQGFIQDRKVAEASFIPAFDQEGVKE